MKNNGTMVELIVPMEGAKGYDSLKRRIGSGPYHVCYIADDFQKDIMRLEKSGWTILKPPAEAPAIDGRKVAFLYNESVGMIELLE